MAEKPVHKNIDCSILYNSRMSPLAEEESKLWNMFLVTYFFLTIDDGSEEYNVRWY